MTRLLSVSLAAVVAVVGLADSVQAANYVVAAPSPTETRTKVQHWVAAQGITDKAILERVGKAWAFDKQSMSGSRVLDMVVGTFSSVDAKTKAFLESCKLASNTIVEAPPLNILDKKTGLNITVRSDKDGVYQVSAEGEGKDKEKRVAFIAGGLMKLGQMEEVKDTLDKIVFPCGYTHDEMLGLLLIRAPNVRAVLREQDMAASRGVLASPSQQK